MGSFKVTGQKQLNGELLISGRKNSALKLIAASVLSNEDVILHRIPDIGDVRTMLQIIEAMGGEVQFDEHTCKINCRNLTTYEIPTSLGRKLRGSLVLVGPLLTRFGKAIFPHPGGCLIGKRTIEPHLKAFENLGVKTELIQDQYHLNCEEMVGNHIYLKEKSVTGTENAIMAAIGARGETILYNAAEETHITLLCSLLRAMGYEINGDGSSTVIIQGKPGHQANTVEITNIADEIEIGTFAVATVLTKGDVTLLEVGPKEGLLPILSRFDDQNIEYQYDEVKQSLRILPSPNLKAADLKLNPWPGFPTDLQAPFTVLATQTEGNSLIHEWMFEGRLYFVSLLQQMGAQIVVCDPHRVIVMGPTPLHRSSLMTPDLRAGAAYVLAALVAEGTSIIEHAELIDRGYDRLDEKLRSLGADIEKID